MKIYYYILSTATSDAPRLARMAQTAQWLEATPTIVHGPTTLEVCADYPHDTVQESYKSTRPNSDPIAEICCFQGHLNIWKLASEVLKDGDLAVIIEDDSATQGTIGELQEALRTIPSNVDWAMLHRFMAPENNEGWEDIDLKWWVRPIPCHTLCTAAYVVSFSGLEILTHYAAVDEITLPVDCFMQELSRHYTCYQCAHGFFCPDWNIVSQIELPKEANPPEAPALLENGKEPFFVASEWMGSWGKELLDYVFRLAYPEARYEIHFTNGDSSKARLLLVGAFEDQEPNCARDDLPYLCWSGENRQVRPRFSHDPIANFSTAYGDDTITWVPMSAFIDVSAPHVRHFDPDFFDRRPYPVAWCSGCSKHRREMFLEFRAHGIDAHALGHSCNFNGFAKTATGREVRLFRRPKAAGNWTNVSDAYRPYQTVLCMENAQAPGYVTEKLMTVFKAGAIPLYWGDAEAASKVFNPNAFVDLSTISDDPQDVAEWVADFLKQRPLLEDMVNEPIFPNNETPDVFAMWDADKPTPKMWQDIADKLRDACGD